MGRRHVLILTDERDQHADLVVQALAVRGVPVFRADAAEFPTGLTMAARFDGASWSGTLRTRHRTLNLATVRSIYYRRPSLFRLPEGLSPAEVEFATAQARHGFGGVLMSLPCLWVNHPGCIADAAVKPRQLRVARRVGFRVPPTLITNEPEPVRAFAKEHAPLVCKPLTQPGIVENGVMASVYTRRLTVDDLDDLTGVRATAHLFQAWVPKSHEVRVTAVGERLFATEIHAESEAAQVDWRADYDQLTYKPCAVPVDISAKILGYLTALDLTFGVFDFVVRPDRRWVFLECGPNANWAWLVEAAGLSIHEAIADVLAGAA
jgi:ATP-grasp ribosomal peptide maturase